MAAQGLKKDESCFHQQKLYDLSAIRALTNSFLFTKFDEPKNNLLR